MGERGQILENDHRIGAVIILRAQFGQRIGDTAFHDHLEQIDGARTVGQAQHVTNGKGFNHPVSVGDGLIHDRQCIADGAVSGPCNHRDGFGRSLDVFLGRDRGQMVGQNLALDAAQIEALAA